MNVVKTTLGVLLSGVLAIACGGSSDDEPAAGGDAGAGGASAGAGGASAGSGGASAGSGGASAGSGGASAGAGGANAGAGGASAGAGGASAGAGGASAGAGGAGSGGASAGAGGGTSAFALTSTGVTEGAAFPSTYTCAGMNVSPPFTWTGAPAAAKSFAIVFTDQSNKLIHWVIWDVPSSVTKTPENIQKVAMPADPAGAKQPKSYDNKTFGYLGPCPGGKDHTYQFALYALDVDALPGVTTASSRTELETAILAHQVAKATLTGTSNAK